MEIKRPQEIEFKTIPILPQVYGDSLSYQELLYKVLYAINDVVNLSNLTKDQVDELYEFIHNSGLNEIVNGILEEWYTTGRLGEIINEMLFGDLENRVKDDEVYSRESTGYGVLVGLNVLAQENPDMSVIVKSGIGHTYVGKRYIQGSDQRITIPPANALYGRWDVIYITPKGVLTHLSGEPSATPIRPEVESGSILLAYVYVNNLVTYILQANVDPVENHKTTLPELVFKFGVAEQTLFTLGETVVEHGKDISLLIDRANQTDETLDLHEQDISSQGQAILDLETQVGEDLQETVSKVSQMGDYNREATGYGVIAGLKVEAQAVPNMSVLVQNGVAHAYDGFRYYQPVYETIVIEPTDGLYPRIDVIYISPDAKLLYGKGVSASLPVAPKPVNGIVLSEVYVSQVAVSISSDDIVDKRVFKITNKVLHDNQKDFDVKLLDTQKDFDDKINVMKVKSDTHINVKEYGAIGDWGSHPLSSIFTTIEEAKEVYPKATTLDEEIDGLAIQKAIDEGYGQIFIPYGGYLINTNILLKNTVSIRGVDTRKTQLIYTKSSGQVITTTTGSSRIHIERLTINYTAGLPNESTAIYMVDTTYSKINDVFINGFKYGIFYTANCWVQAIKDIEIQNCWTGIYAGEQFNSVSIFKCGITFCDVGIDVADGRNIAITHCNIEANRIGVRKMDAGTLDVSDCYFEASTENSIYVSIAASSPEQINISNCTFYSISDVEIVYHMHKQHTINVEGCMFKRASSNTDEVLAIGGIFNTLARINWRSNSLINVKLCLPSDATLFNNEILKSQYNQSTNKFLYVEPIENAVDMQTLYIDSGVTSFRFIMGVNNLTLKIPNINNGFNETFSFFFTAPVERGQLVLDTTTYNASVQKSVELQFEPYRVYRLIFSRMIGETSEWFII